MIQIDIPQLNNLYYEHLEEVCEVIENAFVIHNTGDLKLVRASIETIVKSGTDDGVPLFEDVIKIVWGKNAPYYLLKMITPSFSEKPLSVTDLRIGRRIIVKDLEDFKEAIKSILEDEGTKIMLGNIKIRL